MCATCRAHAARPFGQHARVLRARETRPECLRWHPYTLYSTPHTKYKFLQRYKSFPQNIQKGGVAHFGAAYYEQLLHTEDTKYRLSRAHFYDDQFILARTGEVRMPSFLMDIVFNWKNSSTFCPLKTHGLSLDVNGGSIHYVRIKR